MILIIHRLVGDMEAVDSLFDSRVLTWQLKALGLWVSTGICRLDHVQSYCGAASGLVNI